MIHTRFAARGAFRPADLVKAGCQPNQPASRGHRNGALRSRHGRFALGIVIVALLAGAAGLDETSAASKRKSPFSVFKSKRANDVPAEPAEAEKTAPSRESASTQESGVEEKKSGFWFFKRPDSKKRKSSGSLSWSGNKTAPAPAKNDRETIVRVQVYLDQKKLGPGKVDGELGEFTRKAVAFYNRPHGVDSTNWYYVIQHAEKMVPQAHTTYTIRPEDREHVGSLSYEPEEQAKKSYMTYRTLAELVAERFHTDTNYLARANPGRSIWNFHVGDTIVVPNVEPFRIEDVERHYHFGRHDSLSHRHVIVDTKHKFAMIEENGSLVAAFPITPGQEKFIPYGSWKIDNMVTTPTFRYDKQMLEEGVRGDDYHMLPPGPNSPVGIFWAGLTKSGIGLHGTNNPETIGRARSAGCIRLANWDAVRLSGLVRPGATVEVR